MPADYATMSSQSRKNFDDNWKRQVGCADQYDQAAADAVKQWRFTPALLNAEPVPVVMTVTVNFTLQER